MMSHNEHRLKSCTSPLPNVIEGLACPLYKGDLHSLSEALYCADCTKQYPVINNIPCMIADDAAEFEEEINLQDTVADGYEAKRYSDKYARMYHDWWTDLMIKHVTVRGRVLDNGCGVGHILQRFAPDLAAREIHRVLKPAGEVVFVDPNASLISRLPRWVARGGKHFSNDHKSFSPAMFRKILGPRFAIDKVEYFGYVAYPLLAFPDLLDVFRYVPFKPIAARVAMGMDRLFARIPVIRAQGWAILVKATALAEDCDAAPIPRL